MCDVMWCDSHLVYTIYINSTVAYFEKLNSLIVN